MDDDEPLPLLQRIQSLKQYEVGKSKNEVCLSEDKPLTYRKNCTPVGYIDTLNVIEISSSSSSEDSDGSPLEIVLGPLLSHKQLGKHVDVTNSGTVEKHTDGKRQNNLETTDTASNLRPKTLAVSGCDGKTEQSSSTVVAILDARLTDTCIDLLGVLQGNNIKYKLCQQSVPHSVTWKRGVDDDKLWQENVEICVSGVEEQDALVILTAKQFLQLLQHRKQDNANISDPLHWHSFHEIKEKLPGKRITLLSFGLQNYFRNLYKKDQHAYRSRVMNDENPSRKARSKKSDSDHISLSKMDVQEAIVELQIQELCNVRLLESASAVTETIVSFTKAIVEAPLRSKRAECHGLTFFAEGDGRNSVRVDSDGKGLLLLWQKQLQQFNGVSADMAQAIINDYPSPWSLLQAYKRCSDEEASKNLLANITVRRGVGPLSTSRRIGPDLSKKLFSFLTSDDGGLILESNS